MNTISKLSLLASLSIFIAGCTEQQLVTEEPASIKKTSKILAAPNNATKVADHYVIVFDDAKVARNAVSGEVQRLEKAHGLTVGYVYEAAVRGFSAKVPPGILKKLQEDDAIKRIEEDYEITVGPVEELGKPGGGGSGYTRTTPEQTPWGVSAVGKAVQSPDASWSFSGRRVWIIDTGIDDKHPDLNVNATLSRNFVTGSRQSGSTWQDKQGHGTHVAGTVGARADGYDVVGVAPGVELVAVRCLDSRGSGQYSWIIAGVNHVALNGKAGDVCNMSLGGPGYSALDDAIVNASKTVLFALAAGNESVDCSGSSPARIGLNYAAIWTVSAHDKDNWLATFSNYGLPVDIAAPGVSVTSTRMGGGLTTMSGTSMAAPHVAGILAAGTVGSRGQINGDKDAETDGLAKLVQ